MNATHLTTEVLIDELERRLMIAGVAACRCMTKTPDPAYHTMACPYGRVQRASVDLENIRRQITGLTV